MQDINKLPVDKTGEKIPRADPKHPSNTPSKRGEQPQTGRPPMRQTSGGRVRSDWPGNTQDFA